MPNVSPRLQQQLAFIIEADKLKNIFRQSYITDASRRENDAEHSWHLCLMTIVLAEHSKAENLDVLQVLKMLIIHDIVEIDAGDTYIYDEKARQSQAANEARAADRLFGLLPQDQAKEFRAIWDEFEAHRTQEAKFAKSLDRLHPMMLNALAGGKTWSEHNIVETQVRQVNQVIAEGSPALWSYADELIQTAVKSGALPKNA